jgi:methyl-accepting chemotaxis protein-1 (serine sensor receptor)
MKTLSIKARLALVLFVLAVFLAGVGALGLVGNLRSNAALKETYSNQLASARALGQAIARVGQTRTALDRAIYETDDAKRALLLKAAEDRYKEGLEGLQRPAVCHGGRRAHRRRGQDRARRVHEGRHGADLRSLPAQ